MAGLLTASSFKRELITPPLRNPITQDTIKTPEFKCSKKPVQFEASPEKKEGIAKGYFSEQMKKTFSFTSTPEPEKYSFTKKMLCPEPYEILRYSSSKKRSECTPPPRNPITQEEVPNTPPKIRSKITESSIFKPPPRQKSSKLSGLKRGL